VAAFIHRLCWKKMLIGCFSQWIIHSKQRAIEMYEPLALMLEIAHMVLEVARLISAPSTRFGMCFLFF
jgi:hypothetical protein